MGSIWVDCVQYSEPHQKTFANNYSLNIWKSLLENGSKEELLLCSSILYLFFPSSRIFCQSTFLNGWAFIVKEKLGNIFSLLPTSQSLSLTCQEKHKADIRQWQQSLSTVFYEPRRVIGVHFYNDRVIPINWEFLLSPFCYDTFIKNYKYQL